MAEFGAWLQTVQADPGTAFDAHYRLTAVHPFGDGNGRAARLLMNLMLIRPGCPPMAVRPEDRNVYLDALETASLTADAGDFRQFMHRRLHATLVDYIAALG